MTITEIVRNTPDENKAIKHLALLAVSKMTDDCAEAFKYGKVSYRDKHAAECYRNDQIYIPAANRTALRASIDYNGNSATMALYFQIDDFRIATGMSLIKVYELIKSNEI